MEGPFQTFQKETAFNFPCETPADLQTCNSLRCKCEFFTISINKNFWPAAFHCLNCTNQRHRFEMFWQNATKPSQTTLVSFPQRCERSDRNRQINAWELNAHPWKISIVVFCRSFSCMFLLFTNINRGTNSFIRNAIFTRWVLGIWRRENKLLSDRHRRFTLMLC